MRISMNTRSSGSARIDSAKWLPSGEIRGGTKLVKITEDVRKYAAEHGLTDAEAIERGLEEKSREVVDQGSDLYAKT